MSEELIKRLREQSNKASTSDYLGALLREAIAAIEARPAPVQVPEGMVMVHSDVAEEAADHLRDAAATLKARHSPIEGEWGQYSIDKQARREHDAMLRVADMLAPDPSAPVAVAQEAAFMDAVACGQGFLMRNADGTEAHIPVEDVMQPASPSVDAEKVMGLVEEYGAEMKDLGQHTAEGYALGIMQDEKEAARLHAQIRALLTPATCKEVLQVAGWIPVGEMLPDMEAGYVLVHCEGGKIGDDFFCRNREFLHHSGNRYSRKHQGKESGYFQSSHMYGYRITHWQPLPPPPAIANQEARDEANS